MEKQHRLVIEILKRLHEAGILDQVLLIGSWCAAFYRVFFNEIPYFPVLRTRDIDFLVPLRVRFPKQVDLEDLLSDLGFEVEFSASSGLMKLESEELVVEFLVPEVGPPKTKPHPLPQLGLNAQPIRHLSMLWRDPITISVSGVPVRMPHPADYCLHKLFISDCRKKADKKAKDVESALAVLGSLREKDQCRSLVGAFRYLTSKEKKKVLLALEEYGYEKSDT